MRQAEFHTRYLKMLSFRRCSFYCVLLGFLLHAGGWGLSQAPAGRAVTSEKSGLPTAKTLADKTDNGDSQAENLVVNVESRNSVAPYRAPAAFYPWIFLKFWKQRSTVSSGGSE